MGNKMYKKVMGLKPCPFCAGRISTLRMFPFEGGKEVAVVCRGCGIVAEIGWFGEGFTYRGIVKDVRQQWNTRGGRK